MSQNTSKNKYQVKSPPNFVNFYTRMQQQKNKQLFKSSMSNQSASNFDKYKVPARSQTAAASKPNANRSQIPPPQNNKKAEIQYRRYLCDTNNVFYQQRTQAKSLKFYQTIKPLINYIFIVLFLAWVILYFIRPYPGPCPAHADCGAYVYCHQGYVLSGNQCIVSAQTRQKAHLICQSVIQNLKYQYGNQDCSQNKGMKTIPFMKTQQIFRQYSVNNKATQNQIYDWLEDRNKQQKFGFNFKFNEVSPKVKLHTMACNFQNVVTGRWFYWYFSALVVVLLFVMIGLRVKLQKRRAQKIFQYLKSKTQKQNEIIIKIDEIQSKFGKIYSALWQNVDNLRIQDKSIAFYEDEYLHWKLI